MKIMVGGAMWEDEARKLKRYDSYEGVGPVTFGDV